MKRKPFIQGAVLALAAFGLPLNAWASERPASCMTEDELASVMLYAAPTLIRGARKGCAPFVGAESYLEQHGEETAARFYAYRGESWPAARAAMFRVMSQDPRTRGLATVMEQMPEETLRSAADTLYSEKLAEDADAAICDKVTRGLELTSSLEPRKAARLAAFLFVTFRVEDLGICAMETE
ncbi:hypothetical protein [Altericroceibacterium endophyticum]|uniref:Uncharacterized protein n=1 Tax=Altericroceibacterium endophyticum TaxID=1808508 RepID=A0A6I4T2H1_9SPHN|nr:hypothetical protein [Altericroceibacterium endophyticum]MXO64532.1 hypothetical protein [Altericroceibacterium endophyticum]